MVATVVFVCGDGLQAALYGAALVWREVQGDGVGERADGVDVGVQYVGAGRNGCWCGRGGHGVKTVEG